MSRQLVEYHPVFGHRYVPGLKARVPHESGGYLFQANTCGFRSHHEFAAARSPGKRRILLFGDSFTAGDGVSNRQRYSDLLEELLPETEIFNFGMSGTGTDQQFLIWREAAQQLEADEIVIAIQPENIRRNASMFRRGIDPSGREVGYAKPYFTLEAGQLQLQHQPVPREPRPLGALLESNARVDRGGRFAAVRKAVNALGLKEIAQRVSGYQPLPEYEDASHPDWRLMHTILTEWTRQIEKPTFLFFVPLHHHLEQTADATAVQTRLRELAADTRLPLIDPLPELLTRSSEERRGFRFQQDIHPTPAYHRALAGILSRAIVAAREAPAPTR